MKPYRFRGKTRYGAWTYGSLIHVGDFCCIIEDDYGSDYEYPYLDGDLGCIDGYVTPIKPDTIGQYIGKHDKTGQLIYEGDIVKTKYDRLCKVEWFSSITHGGWDLTPIGTYENLHAKTPDAWDLWYYDNLEVVGNIHDNPELLGG